MCRCMNRENFGGKKEMGSVEAEPMASAAGPAVDVMIST